jgi:putative endonuclease
MFFVYILWSDSLRGFYVGLTEDLELAVNDHNRGYIKVTRIGAPWILVYSEGFPSRSQAQKRFVRIRNWESAKSIRRFLES